MKPNISEFSYGYAITDELVHGMLLGRIIAAPVFPSLFQEGQPNGGYDLLLNFGSRLLFLQFKLSDHLVRRSASECRAGLLPCPFYRMHLRPRRLSRQHEMLLDLERNGNLVFYVAPGFHQPDELNQAYLTGDTINQSVWVSPLLIGDLPDDDEHHVSFVLGGAAFFCSKPRKLSGAIDSNAFSEMLIDSVYAKQRQGISRDQVESLANLVEKLGLDDISYDTADEPASFDRRKNQHPLERLAFNTGRFMNAHLYVVGIP